MTENITIEGEKFKVHLVADWSYNYFWSSGGYAEHKYAGFWYEGTGILGNKENKENYGFHFKTDVFKVRRGDRKSASLQDCFVNYGQDANGFGFLDHKDRIVVPGRYNKIVDISLKNIEDQIKNSNEPVSIITPIEIKYDDLVKLGYIYGLEGQIELALY